MNKKKVWLPFNTRMIIKVTDFDISTGKDEILYRCVKIKDFWIGGNSKVIGYIAIQDDLDHAVYIHYDNVIDYRVVEEF